MADNDMTRKKMMDFKEWYDEDKQELLTESFVESEANMQRTDDKCLFMRHR
jgi:hypothetical protein